MPVSQVRHGELRLKINLEKLFLVIYRGPEKTKDLYSL